MSDTHARHFQITGLVQGVFFRKVTKLIADKLDIKGWVKNNPDGSVEIYAEGTDEQLQKLKQWCSKGPPAAKVTEVKITDTSDEHYDCFEISFC